MSPTADATPPSGIRDDRDATAEPSFPVRLVRSVTVVTGALMSATAAGSYLLGAAAFALPFGQPTPDPFANLASTLALLVGLATPVGAVAGLVVQAIVRQSSLAGPADWRLVTRGLALVLLVSAVFGIRMAWTYEAASWVRVVQTSPAIARIEGASSLPSRKPAVLVYELFGNLPTQTLMWEKHPVTVSQTRQIVTIRRGEDVVDVIDMRRMDYLTEIVATTAALGGTGEWFAVLVRIVSTARRDLLLIYGPDGALVHKEVFERDRSGDGTVLWSAGPEGSRQEFVVDVGSPVRFVAGR
jgi:hypothetical protein